MPQENRLQRNARLYCAARKGELDYAEVRDSQDAEWAENGLRDGLNFGNLASASQQRWASDFRQNLEADFG